MDIVLSQQEFPGIGGRRYIDEEHLNDARESLSRRASMTLDPTRPFHREPGYIYTHSGVPIAENTYQGVKEAQQRRYFHGSPHPIGIGEHIVPGAQIDKDNHKLRGRNADVYSIPSFSNAHIWGRLGGALIPEPSHIYVHEVEPEGFTQRARWIDNEWTAQRAKVTRRFAVPYAPGNYSDTDPRVEEKEPPLPGGQIKGQRMWAFGTSPDFKNGQRDIWEHTQPHYIKKVEDAE